MGREMSSSLWAIGQRKTVPTGAVRRGGIGMSGNGAPSTHNK